MCTSISSPRSPAWEGKKGGQFYTPRTIVQLLVEMLAPYRGRIYDPCCGSGGMFVQSEKFVEAHGGRVGYIHVFGQESNHTTWRLAKMNLAIRWHRRRPRQGAGGHLPPRPAPDLKADYVLANPPFNDSDWRGELLRDDKRWQDGAPPASNANTAWVQHFIHHLAPTGMAGFVLANGSMSSNQSNEGEIRKNIIEADLVDCMIGAARASSSTPRISRCACGSSGGTNRVGAGLAPAQRSRKTGNRKHCPYATAAARCCSSTRGNWAP